MFCIEYLRISELLWINVPVRVPVPVRIGTYNLYNAGSYYNGTTTLRVHFLAPQQHTS